MKELKLISNDERREVAARLRNAEIENLGILNYSVHLGEAIGECVRLVSGHECLVEGGLNRLADLIEPEERICTFTENWNDPDLPLPTCSACGWEAEDIDCVCVIGGPMYLYDGKFCKECGAKVVEQ